VAGYVDRYPHVRLITLPEASYGAALKALIVHSESQRVVIINADLWDEAFFVKGMIELFSGVDLVVGSKRLNPRLDRRSLLRKFITLSFNLMLRTVFGFRGTDTHGLKCIRRSSILGLLDDCVTEREIFDTELVLRAQEAQLSIVELPITVNDSRPPRLSLLKRMLPTIKDLMVLKKSLPVKRVRNTIPVGSLTNV